MKKDIVTIQKDSNLALSTTKSFIGLKNKLVTKGKKELVDDSWIERLFEWSKKNIIQDKTYFPDSKEELLKTKKNFFKME
jgi:ABC-type cobalamin/Fe3+-siderophores transport system ATPase subunit